MAKLTPLSNARERQPRQFSLLTLFTAVTVCGVFFGFLRLAGSAEFTETTFTRVVFGLVFFGALCLFGSLAVDNRSMADFLQRLGLAVMLVTVGCVLVLFVLGPLLQGPARDP